MRAWDQIEAGGTEEGTKSYAVYGTHKQKELSFTDHGPLA